MKPITFPEANVVFAKDQPEYLPLPAFQVPDDPNGQVITRWELSEAELAEIQETKSIVISVYTFNNPLQPLLPYVGVSSFPPAPETKEEPERKIEWERGDLIDNHGHTVCFYAEGTADDGTLWSGTWEECNGEFIEVTEIEAREMPPVNS